MTKSISLNRKIRLDVFKDGQLVYQRDGYWKRRDLVNLFKARLMDRLTKLGMNETSSKLRIATAKRHSDSHVDAALILYIEGKSSEHPIVVNHTSELMRYLKESGYQNSMGML